MFGTHGAQRDEFLKIFSVAGRTLRRWRRRKDQKLELMSTSSAFIFVDWHFHLRRALIDRPYRISHGF